MESKNYQDELAHIRQMMERSSRFISLSGLSGVVAGIVALLGSVYVYFIFQREGIDYFDGKRNIYTPALAQELFFVALVILVLAAMLTPPDIISQLMLAAPMYLLYEISIKISSSVYNRKVRKEEKMQAKQAKKDAKAEDKAAKKDAKEAKKDEPKKEEPKKEEKKDAAKK